jgi:release factor glutamine methyltransferase
MTEPPLSLEGPAAQALRAASAYLAPVSDSARYDAELLLGHALELTRAELLLRLPDMTAPPGYAALIERRRQCEPVAYITGQSEFYGFDFRVTPDCLIPRSDSEVVIDVALRLAAKLLEERAECGGGEQLAVIDLGTGSGCLLLSLLHHIPQARGVGIDQSAVALAVARGNAQALGLEARADFVCADWSQAEWTDKLGAPFDVLLANPPYIESGAALARDVAAYEPTAALFAGDDGLDAYRIIIPALRILVADGGHALLEIGWQQAEAVGALARAEGWQARCYPDLAGRDRLLHLSRGSG